MGPTVEQIEEHIEGSRKALRSNLEELGQRIKSAVDWRERFRSNPSAILTVAFGGGFMLANMLGGARARPEVSPVSLRAAALTGAVEDREGHVMSKWHDIRSALLGVVATKVTNTLAEAVLGFKERVAGRDDDARMVNGRSGRRTDEVPSHVRSSS